MDPADPALNPEAPSKDQKPKTKGKDQKAIDEAERVMTSVRTIVRTHKLQRQAPGLLADIADVFQSLAGALFDPYRPELHYMRGPGPKWHAKHDRTLVVFKAVPALAPVRIKR